MFRVNVCGCVRFFLTRNFIVVLCQQLGEEDDDEEEKKNERNTNEKNHHQMISIFVVDDTVYDCLLKLDISPSRHVLGKRGRI